MTVTDLPPFYNMNYTDEKGNLTTEAMLHNDQTFQTLDAVVGAVNNGWVFPSYNNAAIAVFRDSLDTAVGAVWFSTDDSALKLKTVQATYNTAAPPVLLTPGVIVEIDTTP